MHILMLPSAYPSARRPLYYIFFHEQSKALKAAGHQVNVVVPLQTADGLRVRPSSIVSAAKINHTEFEGLNIYSIDWDWLPHLSARRGFMSNIALWTGSRLYEHYVAEWGVPDVIHAHNTFHAGYVAAHLRRRFNVPVVLTEQHTRFLRSPMPRRQIEFTLRGVNRIFTCGPALKRALLHYVPEAEIEVIGNLVDTDLFCPDPDWDAGTRPFVFAAIGRLAPVKAFDLLLEAFAQAFLGQPVVLRFAGDGELRGALEAHAAALGLSEQVTFLGALPRAGVSALIRSAHAVVSSSDYETFGINLIEGLACGKPVVATRSGGPELFVNEACGLLCDVNNEKALAAAMRRLVERYDTYDPAAIRAAIMAQYSVPAFVARLEAIYTSAMA